MRIIEVTDISLVEKDVITIKKWSDLEEINKKIFNDGMAFNLFGLYYLIGTDVAYMYNSNGNTQIMTKQKKPNRRDKRKA